MDINPYAVSAHVHAQETESTKDIEVDGDCLVISDGCVLPKRCIYSNEVSNRLIKCDVPLYWAKPFRLVLSRDVCRLTYYVQPRFLLSNLGCVILGGGGLLFFCVLSPAAISVYMVWLLVFSVVTIFVLIAMNFGNYRQLRVKKAEAGRFWIAGAHVSFLSSIKMSNTIESMRQKESVEVHFNPKSCEPPGE